MKNLLIMLFGAALGVGGTLLWLRKDIQKQLEEIKKEEEKKTNEVPFQMSDEKEKAPEKSEAPKKETIDYHKVEPAPAPVKEKPEVTEDVNDIHSSDETDGGFYEIDEDEMMHNHEYEKERLVYYRGDKIMATEAGTILRNPFMLVGGEWENCVGNYADNTAFIRNPKLMTDYEIYVEDGLYSDEFGGYDFDGE